MKISKLELTDASGNIDFYSGLDPKEAVNTILCYLSIVEITSILKAVFNQHLPEDRRTAALNGKPNPPSKQTLTDAIEMAMNAGAIEGDNWRDCGAIADAVLAVLK